MNGKCFVDTNVLIYAHDTLSGPKHHQARALTEEIWSAGNGVLSTQVLQEFCSAVRRQTLRPVSLEDVHTILREYLLWEVVINTPTSVLDALHLESRFKISFWDALILTAAEHAGASILYSEDFSNGQRYGAIRVVNPFLG